jgi:hypothetical protein
LQQSMISSFHYSCSFVAVATQDLTPVHKMRRPRITSFHSSFTRHTSNHRKKTKVFLLLNMPGGIRGGGGHGGGYGGGGGLSHGGAGGRVRGWRRKTGPRRVRKSLHAWMGRRTTRRIVGCWRQTATPQFPHIHCDVLFIWVRSVLVASHTSFNISPVLIPVVHIPLVHIHHIPLFVHVPVPIFVPKPVHPHIRERIPCILHILPLCPAGWLAV